MTEPVGIDFNIGGNYQATLAQMIASSDQYAKSADTLLGKIASLNVVTTGLIKQTTALTGVNKTATAEAAAYQQALAGVASTAAVTGKSFDTLRSSALSLARYTGDLGTSVRVIEALGASGIQAGRGMDQMAKAWAQLGAATGFDPVAMGSGLLQLDRAFGNSERNLSKYSDSLVYLTKTYGGNAAGALQFAQALAPVAASVGVSETAVLGLSAAMSRAGSDGAAGVTSITRVLQDMQHSIRDGTPDIRVYASALGMTSGALGNLFKQDPTQVMSKFFDAIGKGGVQASRTLEALGLDAPRTIRAIQAVASQGNLAQFLQASADSFGGGATGKGAEAALSGVNEEAKKLQETLAQTVQAAGQPFLGFLGDVLKVANSFAGAIRNIVSLPFLQTLQTWIAPVRLLAASMTTVITGLTVVGVGRQLIAGRRGQSGGGGAVGMAADFAQGLGFGRGTLMGPREAAPSMAERAGSFMAGIFPEPVFGQGMGNQLGIRSMFRAVRGLPNLAALGVDATARMMNPLTGGLTEYSGPGKAARAAFGNIWGEGEGGFKGSAKGLEELSAAVKRSGIAVAQWGRAVTVTEGGMKNLGGALLRLATQTGAGLGQVGGGVLGAIAKIPGASALANPYVAAAAGGVAALGAGFIAMKHFNDEAAASWEKVRGGMNDVYGSFNKVADAAGLANKGMVSLAVATAKTAQQIAANVPAGQQRGTLTPEQVAGAHAAGYKPTFTAAEGSTQDQTVLQAAQVIAQAGPNASPEFLNNIGMSLESKNRGQGQALLTQAMNLAGKPGELRKQALATINASGTNNLGFAGVNPVGAQVGQNLTASIAQQANAVTDVYGTSAAPQGQSRAAAAAYADALKMPPGPGRKAIAQGIADALQMGEGGGRYVEEAMNRGIDFQGFSSAAAKGTAFGSGMRFQGGSPTRGGGGLAQSAVTVQAPKDIGVAGQAGGLANAPLPTGTMGSAEAATRDLDRIVGTVSGKLGGLGDAIYGADKAARDNHTTVDGLSDANGDLKVAVSATTKAMIDLRSAATPENVQAAGTALAGTARRAAGGNIPSAIVQLQMARQAAVDANDVNTVKGIDASIQQLQRAAPVVNAAQGTVAGIRQTIAAGQIAAATKPMEAGTQGEQDRQAAMDKAAAGYAQLEGMERQFVQADKELKRQWVRQQEDAQLQISRTLQDFNTQRLRSQRDFNIQLERQVEDNAKAMYDPYQRITAQSVWDTASLLANIGEQNQAIAKQTAQVRQLRAAGLSQAASDFLNLNDPKNAMQVQRLVDEASTGNIRQLNATVTQRLSASRAATVNPNNEQYRRQREDYQRGLRDQEADLHRSLGRMNADLQRAHTRSQEDLALMFDETTANQKQLYTQFVNDIAALPKSVQGKLSTNLKSMYDSAWAIVLGSMGMEANPSGKPLNVNINVGGLTGAPGAPGGQSRLGSGASAGNMTAPSISASQVKSSLPNSANQAFAFGAAEDAHASRNWHNACDNFVARAYGLAHSGYVTASSHWAGIPAGFKGGGTPPPGALVFWNTGSAGHAALSVGGGNVYTTDFVRDGHVDVARVNDISKKWGGYLGWSYPYFSGKTAPIAMGDGGIALRAGRYELAERGAGEAVIPLNDRGARVLAETMVRYTDQHQVQAARTAPYASHSTDARSFSYDQRVMVTGPVTIPAEDPIGLARKMEDRARQARLVQPVGRP